MIEGDKKMEGRQPPGGKGRAVTGQVPMKNVFEKST